MPVQARASTAKFDASKYHGLDRNSLIRLFCTMHLSRRLDDREIQLKRQNKIFFQISGAGHEAVTAVAGGLLRPGVGLGDPYYPDPPLALILGVTPHQILLPPMGADD